MNLKEQRGFSLIEILVALFLVTIIITTFSVSDSSFSSRSRLDQTLDNIERAARFGKDEATLRNTVVRVLFNLNEDPQTFSVQFNTKEDFIINDKILEIGAKNQGLKDQEEEEKELKELSKGFSNVDEFLDKPFELPINIKVIAVGSELTKNLQTGNQASIFIYPTGERDGAVVYLMTDQEMASVSLPKFSNKFSREYKQIDNLESQTDPEETYLSMAQEHFSKWLVD